jgi:D-lactate dehydrogenase
MRVASDARVSWRGMASAAARARQHVRDLFGPVIRLLLHAQVHVQNLKPMPVAHGVVDTCMECGFCESACPSGHVTLTPRQRIVATRELARLDMGTSPADRAKADEMRTIYAYQALDTCAADGMCAEKCPVSINTGRMVKDLRAQTLPPASLGYRAGAAALQAFTPLMGAVPALLNAVDAVHGALGTRVMSAAAGLVGPLVGLHWHPYLARGAAPMPATVPASKGKLERKKVPHAPPAPAARPPPPGSRQSPTPRATAGTEQARDATEKA